MKLLCFFLLLSFSSAWEYETCPWEQTWTFYSSTNDVLNRFTPHTLVLATVERHNASHKTPLPLFIMQRISIGCMMSTTIYDVFYDYQGVLTEDFIRLLVKSNYTRVVTSDEVVIPLEFAWFVLAYWGCCLLGVSILIGVIKYM
jgi:hypothetical protein